MKKIILLTLFITHLSVNFLTAQYIVKDQIFSANSVTNEGKVSGYAAQAGPYGIWLPDSGNSVLDIAGIAPGNNVGGQARFSNDGNFICGTSSGAAGAEMAKYDRSTDQWTTLGYLGSVVGNSVSGGFAISGDGNTVSGNSWLYSSTGIAYTDAVAYNPTEALLDLGSLYGDSGKSTRANAVNYDGSVIVGWQDFNGPWKSAVWRKNPSGGYFPNEYILIDTNASATDEYNQMGECSAVSADGEWIGGYGDYANNNEPWIWNKDSGVINLGTFPNVGNGFVSGMSADASVVVGWFDGQLFGDPQTPFIWTRVGGLQELNGYIVNVLGFPTNTHQVYTADCISPDGNFIAGYGVDTSTFMYFVYRVNIGGTSGLQSIVDRVQIKVFPNPTTGQITIVNNNKSVLTLYSMEGKIIYKSEINGTKELNLSSYASGVYSLSIQTGNSIKYQKVVKN